jgi:hypothetical protein
LQRQRHRGIGHVDDGIDLVDVEPLPGDRGAEIGLMLVVGSDDLDLLAKHGGAEFLHRELRRDHRALAADIGGDAGHIGEHTDLDDIVADLGQRRQSGERHQGAACKKRPHEHSSRADRPTVPPVRSQRPFASSQATIRAAISSLLSSHIGMWPLPAMPRSGSQTNSAPR